MTNDSALFVWLQTFGQVKFVICWTAVISNERASGVHSTGFQMDTKVKPPHNIGRCLKRPDSFELAPNQRAHYWSKLNIHEKTRKK